MKVGLVKFKTAVGSYEWITKGKVADEEDVFAFLQIIGFVKTKCGSFVRTGAIIEVTSIDWSEE